LPKKLVPTLELVLPPDFDAELPKKLLPTPPLLPEVPPKVLDLPKMPDFPSFPAVKPPAAPIPPAVANLPAVDKPEPEGFTNPPDPTVLGFKNPPLVDGFKIEELEEDGFAKPPLL